MLDHLTDAEISAGLKKAGLAERLVNDEHWKLLKEGADRVVEAKLEEFAYKADPTDVAAVVEMQTILKMYKFGLFDNIISMSNQEEEFFEEVEDRGLLSKIFPNFR